MYWVASSATTIGKLLDRRFRAQISFLRLRADAAEDEGAQASQPVVEEEEPAEVQELAPVFVVLGPGRDAMVNTTGGDRLRVREEPGFDEPVVALLADGTIVALRRGPRDVDGYNWWRIQTEDGTTGWVVEAIDGINTLVPLAEE